MGSGGRWKTHLAHQGGADRVQHALKAGEGTIRFCKQVTQEDEQQASVVLPRAKALLSSESPRVAPTPTPIHFLGVLESWGLIVRYFILGSVSLCWLPLDSSLCPQKLLEKDEPAVQILRQKSYLVLPPNLLRGCIGGPCTATGGWSEQRISMRFMKDSEEANSICIGLGTALGPSGAPNRPHSSSQIISLLQVPRVEAHRAYLWLNMI